MLIHQWQPQDSNMHIDWAEGTAVPIYAPVIEMRCIWNVSSIYFKSYKKCCYWMTRRSVVSPLHTHSSSNSCPLGQCFLVFNVIICWQSVFLLFSPCLPPRAKYVLSKERFACFHRQNRFYLFFFFLEDVRLTDSEEAEGAVGTIFTTPW